MGAAMRYQPQGLARLNPASPLTRGLVHNWATNTGAPNGIRDTAGFADAAFGLGAGSSPSGNTWQIGPDGFYVACNDAGTGQVQSKALTLGNASGSGAPGSNAFTIHARVRFGSVTTTGSGNGTDAQTIYGGPNAGGIQFRISTPGAQLQLVKANTVAIGSSTGAVAAGVDYDLTVAYDGTTAAFYINGVLSGTASSAQTFNQAGQHFAGANAYSNGLPTQEMIANGFRLYRLHVWNRALAGAEVAQMAANPWQIFSDPARSQPVAAVTAPAGTTVTGNLGTVSATGQSTSVINGTTVAASLGTVSAAGPSASVTLSTTLSASLAAASATGRSASVTLSTTLSASLGTVSAAGQFASVSSGAAISASLGTASAAGMPAAVTLSNAIAASTAASTAAGQPASVTSGAAISASLATASAAGQPAGVTLSTVIAASAGTASATGQSASVTSGAAISASVATCAGAGQSAALATPAVIAAGLATVTGAGQPASTGAGVIVTCGAAASTATGRTGTLTLASVIGAGPGRATVAGVPAGIAFGLTVSASVATATATGLPALVPNGTHQILTVNPDFIYIGAPRQRAYTGNPRQRGTN